MIDNILNVFKKSFTFEGRASRAEFWGFQLFYIGSLIAIIGIGAIGLPGADFLAVSVVLISLPAQISMQVRRLHDIGWSGFWLLLNFIPYIGGIVLLVAYCFAGNLGPNEYGEEVYGTKKKIEPLDSSFD